ncbi:MAG TPA: PAS domain S-box protein [Magnetospirillaceae bacterium]|jgi:PAS domain S-box-containing protein
MSGGTPIVHGWRVAIPILILTIGTALTFAGFYQATQRQNERIRDFLDLRVESRMQEVRHKLAEATVSVAAVADFIASQANPTAKDVERFAYKARGVTPVLRLAWAPSVMKEARATFEDDVQRIDGRSSFAILDPRQGQLAPAGDRSEYAPIRAEQVFGPVPSILGIDLLADTPRRAPAIRALNQGIPVATDSFLPIFVGNTRPIILVFWPVYGDIDQTKFSVRQPVPMGLAMGAYFTEDLIRYAISDIPEIVARISFFIGDAAPGDSTLPALVYEPDTKRLIQPATASDRAPGSLRLSRSFEQFGRQWTTVFDFPAPFVAGQRSPERWFGLALGLGFTMLLAAYVSVEQRRRSFAEATVVDRTRELARSSEHLHHIQQAGKIGTIEVDLVTQRATWSAEIFHLVGLDPTSARPSIDVLLDAAHPEDRAGVQDAIERETLGQEFAPIEFRIVKDGVIRWLSHSSNFVRNAEDVPQTLIVTLYDVTSRVEAQQAAMRMQTLLAAIVESSDDAIISKTLDGIVTSWNAAATAIFGHTSAEMLGRSISVLAVPGREDDMTQILARVKRDERVEHYETQRRHKSGAIIDISLTVSPIHDSTGKIIGASKTARDITATKRAEAQRQSLEAQLRQSQRMEVIGQMTGGIAHDFNNLLTVVMGRIELVDMQVEEESPLRDSLRACLNAARRGASLTRSMLTFARQQPQNPEPIDVVATIADAVEMLPRTLGEAIAIKTKYEPSLWRCMADSALLQNALLNLAVNARDAMPAGGTLTVEASNARLDAAYAAMNADVSAGEYVALSVSDTGTGMSAETIARVFEPFFTTKEVGKGTGLGLSMVYGFAKQSGGHVKIYSELGIGTTIRLYLPRSTTDVKSEISVMAPQRKKPATGKQTVLLIEDDDDIRALATIQLTRLGYTVISGGSGPEGLRLLERHPEIVLLLTDLTLPEGISGVELAGRALQKAPELRVLYMSGYTEDAVINQGRGDASIRLLQKPFGIEELERLINAVLD